MADDVDSQLEKEILHRVKSHQSIWDKVKGWTRGRARQSLYEKASELGDADRDELERLIVREETGPGDGSDSPILAAQPEEETLDPALEFDPRFDASRMLESLPSEIGSQTIALKEKEREHTAETEAGVSESAREEVAPAAASTEMEAEIETVPETQEEPPKPVESLEKPGQETPAPKEETPFSADELLGSLLSEEEEEESEALPEPEEEALVPLALAIEEPDESLPEPELEAIEESVNVPTPESPVGSNAVSKSESQPAMEDSVTIDELLGGMDEPEAWNPRKQDRPRLQERSPKKKRKNCSIPKACWAWSSPRRNRRKKRFPRRKRNRWKALGSKNSWGWSRRRKSLPGRRGRALFSIWREAVWPTRWKSCSGLQSGTTSN
jgi:hypothetical protein